MTADMHQMHPAPGTGRTLPYSLRRRMIATRKETGLSQEQIAGLLGVDRSTVARSSPFGSVVGAPNG